MSRARVAARCFVMNDEELARLQLDLTPRVSPVGVWAWIRKFGSARAVLGAGPDDLEAGGVPAAAIQQICGEAGKRLLERELRAAESQKIQFLFPPGVQSDEGVSCPGTGCVFPNEFHDLEAPSLVIRAQGRVDLLQKSRVRVAIVGARTPTPYGFAQSSRFASSLGDAGIVIVSGFARGVDRAAHATALDRGHDTIGVLGSGLCEPYPSDRPDLLEKMRKEGLLLSEFALESRASRITFPRRNRTLAALSVATLVVEAGEASGSLITARHAEDLGRPIFAIPGRIDSPMSAGCHALLRDGCGILCSDPAEILERIQGRKPASSPVTFDADDEVHRDLLARAAGGATLEELATAFRGPEGGLFSVLCSLEMRGALERAPGGLYRCIPSRVVLSRK